MDIEIGQIIAQVIAFLLMLAILKRFAWKPLMNVMTERQERIRNEFATIEQEKQEVETLRTSYENELHHIEALAKKLGQEEVNKSRVQAREIEEEAHKRGREILNKAHLAAQDEFVKVKEELKEYIVKLTMATTEAVLQESLDKEEQQKLINAYIKKAELR